MPANLRVSVWREKQAAFLHSVLFVDYCFVGSSISEAFERSFPDLRYLRFRAGTLEYLHKLVKTIY